MLHVLVRFYAITQTLQFGQLRVRKSGQNCQE